MQKNFEKNVSSGNVQKETQRDMRH